MASLEKSRKGRPTLHDFFQNKTGQNLKVLSVQKVCLVRTTKGSRQQVLGFDSNYLDLIIKKEKRSRINNTSKKQRCKLARLAYFSIHLNCKYRRK